MGWFAHVLSFGRHSALLLVRDSSATPKKVESSQHSSPLKQGNGSDDRFAIAPAAAEAQGALMLNLISILIGTVALALGLLAFMPLLGWAYWLIIPIALVGLVLGMMSDRNVGRNLNLVVIVIGVVRLMLGGGLI